MMQLIKGLLVAAGTLAALAGHAQQKITLSIATGPTGGVYYPMGGGMANILTKYVPGLSVTAESTAGSIANLEFILTKKADVALSMADASWDAHTCFKAGARCNRIALEINGDWNDRHVPKEEPSNVDSRLIEQDIQSL